MAIEATNNAQNHNSLVMPVLTSGAAATAGYFIGSPITAREVLKQDTFELSKKAKDVTEVDNQNVSKINASIAEGKDENVKAAAEQKANGLFNGKNEMTVEEYLGKTPEEYENSIKESQKELPELQKGVNAAQDELETKEKALAAADEAGKDAATVEKTKAETALKEAQAKFDGHQAKIHAQKAELEFAQGAKDGKITKEAYVQKATKEIKNSVTENIDETLKSLKGKTPRLNSIKKAGVYGAVTLASIYIMSKLFSSPKNKA